MTFKRIGIAFASVLLVIVLAAAYLGLFATMTVTEGVAGPFTFVYRERHGSDMSVVGRITTAVATALEGAGIVQRQPLAVVLDPENIPFGLFRSAASCRGRASHRRT